ncbi:unnamed protein product [Cladocopium goreaui]|uniref:Uncharacterized protein n=1 Tax=Cladocopium goreaui TaxID=2562237 RepID=A0A9P1CQW9_9DINO|nr:unnamed protein product [Cladocopium goreaui]
MLGLALELQGDDTNNELALERQDAAPSPDRGGGGDAISEEESGEARETKSEPQSKHKRKRKVAQAKAAAADARNESRNENPESEAYKKCQGPCGKRKLSDQFNLDQAKCKECSLNVRSFWKNAKSQKVDKEMKNLEEKDPNTFKDILKEYCRERATAAQNHRKVKFNITEYKEGIVARSGDRKEVIREMMWEGQWMEAAKTAAHGFLTTEEAQSKWKQWEADPAIKKDDNGPRGFQRIAVPTRTELAEYEDVGRQRELMQAERISRNAKAETLTARAEMVLSEGNDPEKDRIGNMNLGDIRAKAQSSGVDMSEMCAPQIGEIADSAAAKRRRSSVSQRKKGDEDSQEDMDQEEKSESENDKCPEKGKKGKDKDENNKGKWFDAETKCRKAERVFLASIDSLQSNMEKVIKETQAALEEFRQAPDREEFQEEMQILERCVGKKLKEESQKKRDADDSKTTSRDVSALHRAGPCRDFELLKSLEYMRRHATNYRTCQSNDAIKKVTDESAEWKKVALTLLTAVKAAKTDLQSAKKRKDANQKKEEDKVARAAKAAAKSRADKIAAKGRTAEADTAQGKVRKRVAPQGIQGTTAAVERLGAFGKVFTGSSLRVTEGRAHAVWNQHTPNATKEMRELVAHMHVAAALPVTWRLHSEAEKQPPSDACSPAENKLDAAMKISTFGLAGCTVSHSRTEVGLLPCFRWVQAGTMMVAVGVPQTNSDMLQKMQDIMQSSSEDSIQKVCREEVLRFATVGPGDLLYIPPGAVVSHKVHSQDVLGMRFGILADEMKSRLESLVQAVSQQPPLVAVLTAAVTRLKPIGFGPEGGEEVMACDDDDAEEAGNQKAEGLNLLKPPKSATLQAEATEALPAASGGALIAEAVAEEPKVPKAPEEDVENGTAAKQEADGAPAVGTAEDTTKAAEEAAQAVPAAAETPAPMQTIVPGTPEKQESDAATATAALQDPAPEERSTENEKANAAPGVCTAKDTANEGEEKKKQAALEAQKESSTSTEPQEQAEGSPAATQPASLEASKEEKSDAVPAEKVVPASSSGPPSRPPSQTSPAEEPAAKAKALPKGAPKPEPKRGKDEKEAKKTKKTEAGEGQNQAKKQKRR